MGVFGCVFGIFFKRYSLGLYGGRFGCKCSCGVVCYEVVRGEILGRLEEFYCGEED